MTARFAACCIVALLVYAAPLPAQEGAKARLGPSDYEKAKPDNQSTQDQCDQSTLATIEKSLDELSKRLTVTLLDDNFKLTLGGAVTADFFFNSARPVAPGTPYYLTPGPGPGIRQNTF